MLIAARAVMGACAALIFPTTLSIIANAFPDRRARAAALGGWSAITGVGVAAGPIVGGALVGHYFWGSVFWALVPVAGLAAAVALVAVPESRDPGVPPLDRVGLSISVLTLALLTYATIEAPSQGWSSEATWLEFAVAAALVVAFIAVERRIEHPMLDVRLFTDRRFSAASGAVTIQFFALSGFIFLMAQYFQIVRGFSAFETGTRMLPVAMCIAIASVIGNVLAPRLGTRLVVATGLACFGLAMAWTATSNASTPYWSVIMPQMVLFGLGMGFTSAPATESIMRVLPPAQAGVGSAVNDATRQLGGTLGVAIVGSIFSTIFAARLAETPYAGSGHLDQARDSVAYAFAMAGKAPDLLESAQHAFIAGQQLACWILAALSLLGAAASAVALPGREAPSPDPASAQPEAADLAKPAA
jgi:EmrB/QacA subfamily drug resistance transporter